MKVYFDNASSTPLLPEVVEEMSNVMKKYFGNPSSIHSYGRKSKSLVEASRKRIAEELKASIGEIFFTSGATEANNTMIRAAVEDYHIDTIIYNPTEHHCVLYTLQALNKTGTKLLPIEIDKSGEINYQHLDTLLKENENHRILTTVMHANNEIGTINDIKKIGDLCYNHGALFHSDTVQTIGKYKIDLSEINIHYASASSHKFFGPKGCGYMYINNDKMIRPYILGGSQERNMRAGTENVYGIVGTASAFASAGRERKTRLEYITDLRNYFKQKLTDSFYDIRFNGSDQSLYNIVSVSFPASAKADMLMFNLDIAGIAASSGSACSSGIESESHVLQAIGHDPKRKTVRFSFSHFNTREEIDYTIEKLSTMTPLKESV